MKRKFKLYTVKLSNLINRNTGFLIVFTIIVFGFAVVAFQKDNQLILQDTHAAVENTRLLLEQREAERMERDKAVQKVVEANTRSDEQQTLILCTLILRGNVEVTDEEAIQIEQICQEEIQRFQDRGAEPDELSFNMPSNNSPQPNQPTSPPSNNPSTPPSSNASPETPPSGNEPPSEPPEDRTTIGGFLRETTETITNLTCNVARIFC